LRRSGRGGRIGEGEEMLDLDICPAPPEFLVTPLLTGDCKNSVRFDEFNCRRSLCVRPNSHDRHDTTRRDATKLFCRVGRCELSIIRCDVVFAHDGNAKRRIHKATQQTAALFHTATNNS